MKEDKTVCYCNRVTISNIETAIKNGATTFDEIQEKTKVSQSCGRCKEYAQSIIAELLGETV